MGLRRWGAALVAMVVLLGGLTSAPASATEGEEAVPNGRLTGVVALAPGATWSPGTITVTVELASGFHEGDQWLSEPGESYSFDLFPATYRVWAEYYNGDGDLRRDLPVTVTVTSGATTTADLRLVPSSSISGRIDAGGVPPAELEATARDLEFFSGYRGHLDYDPATGDYTITGLAPGRVSVGILPHDTLWQPMWWHGAGTEEDADPITLGVAQHRTGFDFSLRPLTRASGTITTIAADGAVMPAENVLIRFDSGSPIGIGSESTVTDQDGHYAVALSPGRYSVEYSSSTTRHSPEQSWVTSAGADLEISDGEVLTGVDGRVDLGGAISGTVTSSEWEGGSFVVVASRWDEASGTWIDYSDPDGVSAGDWYLDGVPAGEYRVRFSEDYNPSGVPLRTEYFNDTPYASDAELVTVEAGELSEGVDAVLDAVTYRVFRVAGMDRYAVAARLSASTFEPGAPVVYVASGEKYPDALSAGPAAAHEGGGLLLVGRDTVPESTRAELVRLAPQRIVVVGGPASVSAAVYAQLAELTSSITRIGGADRYEVSRAVVERAFCVDGGACDADTIYVATGENFPDALTAGPAAAHDDGAILLVPGSAAAIDLSTKQLLRRLGVDKGYITGGPRSVSPEMENSLRAVVPGLQRLTGADRYAVGVAVAKAAFGGVETAFVASGEVFPDALSGGPVAAASDSPVLLVHHDCIPVDVADELVRLNPVDIVLIGGTATLRPEVESFSAFC